MAAWVSLGSPTTNSQNLVVFGLRHPELCSGEEGVMYGPEDPEPCTGDEGWVEPNMRVARSTLGLDRGAHSFNGMVHQIQYVNSPIKPPRDVQSPRQPIRSVDASCDRREEERHDEHHIAGKYDSIRKLELPRIPSITTLPRIRNNSVTDSPKKPTRSVDVDTLPRIPCRNHSKRDLRRVRFGDAIVSATFVYPGVEEELFSGLYYSKREISEIRTANKHRALSIEVSNQNVVPSILHLCGVLTHVDTPALSDRDAASHLVRSGARGLEHFLTPRFGLQRERTVRMILEVQEEYEDSDDIESLLRKWSETLSSSSCLYARNVAVIDAREAIRESIRFSTSSSRSI